MLGQSHFLLVQLLFEVEYSLCGLRALDTLAIYYGLGLYQMLTAGQSATRKPDDDDHVLIRDVRLTLYWLAYSYSYKLSVLRLHFIRLRFLRILYSLP